MTPLDLSLHPPRSARAALEGIVYLPRAIDKVRAELPGGNPGAYLVLSDHVTTISALFYRKLKIAHEEFVAAVADAKTEEEVASWLRGRTDEGQIQKWHDQLLNIRLADVPASVREGVIAAHPVAAGMPESTLMVDVFDADDASAFPAQERR